MNEHITINEIIYLLTDWLVRCGEVKSSNKHWTNQLLRYISWIEQLIRA